MLQQQKPANVHLTHTKLQFITRDSLLKGKQIFYADIRRLAENEPRLTISDEECSYP